MRFVGKSDGAGRRPYLFWIYETTNANCLAGEEAPVGTLDRAVIAPVGVH